MKVAGSKPIFKNKSYPVSGVRVMNNLQGEGKGDSVECRGEEEEEEEMRESERKKERKRKRVYRTEIIRSYPITK